MAVLYNFAIGLVSTLYFIAKFFNPKARAFVVGRRNFFRNFSTAIAKNNSPLAWIHCASLGEFEQARPVMESMKNILPDHKILLTFFSPSGYEVRKNYSGADYIFYLPWDTSSNARRFIALARPRLAIFVKYEFWPNFIRQLKAQAIPLISISCIFRPQQIFFRPAGGFFRGVLRNFSHFFVQNKSSLELLKSIRITSATLTGDTRFDRIIQNMAKNQPVEIASRFKDGKPCWVIGSSWPEDLEVLAPFINENKGRIKFILAPHEITEATLRHIEFQLEVKSLRYSKASENPQPASVLIIDNIGMLSNLYRYAEFAYVGGAFGQGLHNILEAAGYGIPVFFGNRNYKKFKEANDLILRGGAFEVNDFAELKLKYESVSRQENYHLACEVTKQYVQENTGATSIIMNYIQPLMEMK